MTDRQTPAFRERAEAALVALAAGDALGWPQEFPGKVLGGSGNVPPTTAFRTWLRRGGGRFYGHEERIEAGEYSDDTQLTLAVARCRMFGGTSWWGALTRTELPLWSLYERGGGGGTKRAVGMWIKGKPPWSVSDSRAVRRYFDAGGNGVTMRVLPHAIFYACEADPASLMRDVVSDGVATHGHPRALLGATAYAFAAWWLLRSERTVGFGELVQVLLEKSAVWGALPANPARNSWFDAATRSTPNGYVAVWSSVVDEMRHLLQRVEHGLNAGAVADDDEILRDLGCFGKAKGAGTVSTAAAVYLCSRYAAQPVQAVLKAAFANRADTDTIAAMSGGLMGCLAGQDWLPREWAEVQDYEYLRKMANHVAQGPAAAKDRLAGLRTIGQKELAKLRAALADGTEAKLDFDGIRHAEVNAFLSLKPLSTSTVAKVWHLRVSDGQTIYVTKLGRSKSKAEARSDPRQRVSSEPSSSWTNESTAFSTTAAGLKLTVTNVKAMSAFYERVLGLRPDKRSSRFVSFGALSLIASESERDRPGGAVGTTTEGRRHCIQVRVNDLEAAYRRLAQSGAQVVLPITEMSWGERMFQCADTEGNLVEVIETR